MLILQFRQSAEFSSDEDLEFRHELEQLAAATLRASNNGVCDGGDLGSGTINIFCSVTDPAAACDSLVEALEAQGLEGAVIAFVDDNQAAAEDPQVLWPRDYLGTFSIL